MRERILIVDDVPANIDVLGAFLEPAGFEVLAAPGGEKALALARRARPSLVLLDVMMPGLDGYGVLRGIRALEGEPVPVIMLTASADAESAAKAWNDGVDHYLAKPFRADEVLDLIDGLLGEGVGIPDA
jgi:CheY-like chemotaxis protein